MPTAADLDYWTTSPAPTPDRPLGRVNPLAFLNPGECGAWVATLQALRALPPSTSIARPPRPVLAVEEVEHASVTAAPEPPLPGLDDACGA